MNAEFFALAFVAALNPKFLAVDLLLIENRRPRAMFLCVLLGGMTVALTIGLLATGRLHGRRKAPVPAVAGPPQKEKKDGWAQRALAEPRLGLAMLIGALAGPPGGASLRALHNLVTGKSSTATQVIAVIIFVIIEFSLVIIPFAFLELRHEDTKVD